jgi:hypothetical protein
MKMNRKIWTGGLATSVSQLNPIHFFLLGCMKLKLYHSGKPETRQQLVEAIDAATLGIGDESPCT